MKKSSFFVALLFAQMHARATLDIYPNAIEFSQVFKGDRSLYISARSGPLLDRDIHTLDAAR